VGELDPQRGNVNDRALDEVLRRDRCLPTPMPTGTVQRFPVAASLS